MTDYRKLEEKYGALNYHPLPVVLHKAEGVYAWDVDGKRYIDMMSAYSAVSFGHRHPRILKALLDQIQTLAVVSRAYYTDQLGPLLQRLHEVTGLAKGLPMNTGAEAVETALKAARKWGYKVKGIPDGKAEIIVCDQNFHGRTITIVGFSSDPQYRDGFGPYPAGFVSIPFNDTAALEAAINENTAAFMVEPVQGEAGIIVPDEGYLARCYEICKANNVLLISDEVQAGMGRTGKDFAFQHDGILPDGLILGKALGGGLLPVSMVLGSEELMGVFNPGDHGSTFGGNPLACAVAREAVNVLVDEDLSARSAELGEYLIEQLNQLNSPLIRAVRGKGLFVALEIEPSQASAREVCERLITAGLLSKETHETVVRLAPPLTITREELDEAVAIVQKVLQDW